MADSTKPDRHRKVIIIGFKSSTGFQSGKSTAAKKLSNWLKDSRLASPVKVSLANDVKLFTEVLLKRVWGLEVDLEDKSAILFKDSDGTETTLRDLYVQVGMAGREVDPNFWVDRVKADMLKTEKSVGGHLVFIFDDIRFFNEKFNLIDDEMNAFLFDVIDVTALQSRVDSSDLQGLRCGIEHTIFNDKVSYLLDRQLKGKVFPLIKKVLRDEV